MLRLVLSNAVRVVAAGLVIGFVLAALLGRVLITVLFGVEPLDALNFGAVAVVLAVTAGLATAAPAWRAIRVIPSVALRSQ